MLLGLICTALFGAGVIIQYLQRPIKKRVARKLLWLRPAASHVLANLRNTLIVCAAHLLHSDLH